MIQNQTTTLWCGEAPRSAWPSASGSTARIGRGGFRKILLLILVTWVPLVLLSLVAGHALATVSR